MIARRTAAVAVPFLLVAALVGCAPGSESDPADDAGGSSADPSSAPAGGSTECLADRVWTLDVADAAAQLGAYLGTTGMAVTQSDGSGTQTITLSEDGTAAFQTDVTYTITIVQDDLTFTLVQTQSGDSGGEWAWAGDSDTVTFPSWDDSTYSVQNQFLVNGAASESAMTIPNDIVGGSNMAVDCSGSTLVTMADGSPFTHRWTTSD